MQKETTTKANFKRKALVGYNFLSVKEKEPVYINITGLREITNKEGTTNKFWEATNMETGEEGLVYLDGGLRGQTSALGGPDKCVGKAFEITHMGHNDVEINGEEIRVNAYKIYEVEH